MENFSAGDLDIELADNRVEAIRCVWKGSSNDRHPNKILAPYFSDLLQEAESDNLGVEMHFEHLERLNSSTITALIKLIQDCRSRAIKLTLYYNDRLKWQKLSFDALRVFVRDDDLFELRAAQ